MTNYRYLCFAVLIVAVCVQQIKAGGPKKNKIMRNKAKEIDRKDHSPEDEEEDLFARMIYMTNGTKTKPPAKVNKKMKVKANSMDKHRMPQTAEMQLHFDDEGNMTEPVGNKKRYVRRQKRSFVTYTQYYWPQSIVPYEIHASINSTTVSSLMYAMQVYRNNTCIDWQPHTAELVQQLGHNNYVRFIDDDDGCWSYVGRVGSSSQDLGLQQPECTSNDTIIHEMGHATGMWHTQARQDRDDYVKIEWDNIASGKESNFYGEISTDYAKYDYGSDLQSDITAFGNGKQTISFLDSNLEFLPSQTLNDLSFYDIQEITIAYKCASYCVSPPACQNRGFVNFNCQCHCPEGQSGATCTEIDGNCGSIIDLQSGEEKTINSSNYGTNINNGNYDLGEECVWLIQAPAGMLVSMTVDHFNVSKNAVQGKCYHWFEIKYNLMGQPGPILCGDAWTLGTLTTTLNGDQNLMMLRFNSAYASNTGPSTGFSLRVRARNVGCLSNPCMNGANCSDAADGMSYTCACDAGTSGTICEVVGDADIKCSFEYNTTCFMKNQADDPFDWTRFTGPSYGRAIHTSYNGYHYSYAYSGFQTAGDIARLTSAVTFTDVGERCIVFAYILSGTGVGSLHLYIEGTNVSKKEIWPRLQVPQQGHWTLHGVSVPAPAIPEMKVIFEGVAGSSYKGEIGLDDIEVRSGTCGCTFNPCQNGGTCSVVTDSYSCICATGWAGTNCDEYGDVLVSCGFESGTDCFLEDETTGTGTDQLDWTILSGSTPSPRTGPSAAHGGTHYAYLETSGVNPNETARLSSYYPFSAMDRCLVFYYHMYGFDVNELNVYKEGTNLASTMIWSKSGSQWNQWAKGTVDISSVDILKITFEAKRGVDWIGDIAIDDISLAPKRCVCESDPCKNGGTCSENSDGLTFTCTCTAGFSGDVCNMIGTVSMSCTYEIGTSCFMEDLAAGDNFDWTVNSGSTLTPSTGPSVANGGQLYNFIETSLPRVDGDVARLDSSSYSFTEIARCLVIHYHMYGRCGSLKVFTKGTGHAKTEIWSKTGQQTGDEWHTAINTINAMPGLGISIEGIRGVYYDGDIAIDDLVLTPYACGCESDSCKNGGICSQNDDGLTFTCTCTAGFSGDVCNIIDTATLSCTYEIGTWCFMGDDTTGDDFDWTVNSGGTPTNGSGPSAANSGQFYNFIETSSPQVYEDVARLDSSSYSFTEIARCLEIHYHMYGFYNNYYGSLKVFTKGTGHDKTEIWSKTGSIGDVWKTENITINAIPDLKISIEGIRGLNYDGDIAIDDLVLTPNACALP